MSINKNDQQMFELFKTKRGKDLIFYKNYFFTLHSNRADSLLWRCQDRGCLTRLITSLDKEKIFNVLNAHNHILSENDISKKQLFSSVKVLAENSAYSTHQVYSMTTSARASYEMPITNKDTVYKIIRNARKRKSIIVDHKRNLEELNIKTLRGENFCIFDSGVDTDDRIVILGTDNNLGHLQNGKILIADGTFKVCPKEFEQLYVIHGMIASNVFALVYILLKTKKEVDYLRAFNKVVEKCKFNFPESIIIDFEFAAYVAFKKATKSKIYFCLFHFGQIIWRQIQALKLSNEFLVNRKFRFFMKCVTSLAFVPSDFVEIEYTKLLKESKSFEHLNLTTFFQYFEKNYLSGTRYPIASWNAHRRILEDIPLTSNSAEVFNRHFYGKFDQSHPGLSTFFEKLKVNQSSIENDIEYRLSNIENFSNTKYKIKLESIKVVCRNYSTYCNMTYLYLITKLYSWKFD